MKVRDRKKPGLTINTVQRFLKSYLSQLLIYTMSLTSTMEHDLLIIVDSTASMSTALRSLNTSLPQIISVSALTGCFSRIGLLGYRDYDCKPGAVLEWSGWMEQGSKSEAQPDLVSAARNLKSFGGYSFDEAIKTALARAYEEMRPEAKTLILLFTDAEPHTNCNTKPGRYHNQATGDEEENLSTMTHGKEFIDWVSAARMFTHGEKKAQVFTILSHRASSPTQGYYNFMSRMTGGICIRLRSDESRHYSNVTIGLLLEWMSVDQSSPADLDKSGSLKADMPAYVVDFAKPPTGIDQLREEGQVEARQYFNCACDRALSKDLTIYVETGQSEKQTLTPELLKKHVPKTETPVMDFATRWKTDESYKALAFTHLLSIIRDDVSSLALNPLFGTLWRTICNNFEYPGREEALKAFSTALNKMNITQDKENMQIWLEESYDYTKEVLGIIGTVPQEEQYPCVFLDPTLNFAEMDGTTEASKLSRRDLLEIGRSCHATILRQASRVLSRLTFAASADDIPEHIAKAGIEQVPRVPLALASDQYKHQFWRIVLHLIVPGTLLSTRPAALVAALSLRVGLTFLKDAAVYEMLRFKDRWNDIETPETWTLGCLGLLLDADEIYQNGEQLREDRAGEDVPTLLNPDDRALFKKLIDFKMIEFNLDATLTARVPWTPNKSVGPIGPLVACKGCHYPRSVTMMGPEGKCGICHIPEDGFRRPKDVSLNAGVSMDTTSTTNASWVECHDQSCRAQYVVYNVDELRVRAKCYYCRMRPTTPGFVAPVVNCSKCFNNMIWPEEYRPADFEETQFVCPHCVGERCPTDEFEFIPKSAKENTLQWLIQDTQDKDKVLFENRSIFFTLTNFGIGGFNSRVVLFPPREGYLTRKGKPILNTEEIISAMKDRVMNRKAARSDCSLCFSNLKPSDLHPACGRRGCLQSICRECLGNWYGLNSEGGIINTAALACPFCRRLPASRTLAKYGMGIHAVQNLSDAVRDRGTLIYAWCRECCTAKEFMERDCARGAPPSVTGWTCKECLEAPQKRRLDQELQWATQALIAARESKDSERIAEAEKHRDSVREQAQRWGAVGIKPCPGCGMLSERTSGCGHISCPVEECGVDWCYFCGGQFDGDEIYGHMEVVHGGLFGGEFENAMDSDED